VTCTSMFVATPYPSMSLLPRSQVIPNASTTSGRSTVLVSRTTSLDSSRRISHVTSNASTTSGRITAVPMMSTTSFDPPERMTRVTSNESTTSGRSTVPVSCTTSFDSHESLASEDLQELQPLYRLVRVATPQTLELESAGRDTSPTSLRNEHPETEAEQMTSKLIRYYSHHLLSLTVTTPILKLQRMMNFRLQRALETWRARCVQHKFSMCSTDVQRVMNSTLAGALRTWKQRTAGPGALERRRMKLLQEKGIEHLLDRQLKKHFVAWQAQKKQVNCSRLHDPLRCLQDRRRNSLASLKPGPELAWNKRLSRHQLSQLVQDVVPRSQQHLQTRCSAPTLGSETGPDFIRGIFARIQKSRNAYQVLIIKCLFQHSTSVWRQKIVCIHSHIPAYHTIAF